MKLRCSMTDEMLEDYLRVVRAHDHSSRNRSELLGSEVCGCFDCLAIFPPSEIVRWIDEPEPPLFRDNRLMPQIKYDQTAVCPECGVDSVIGSKSGYPITIDFLRRMQEHWFRAQSL